MNRLFALGIACATLVIGNSGVSLADTEEDFCQGRDLQSLPSNVLELSPQAAVAINQLSEELASLRQWNIVDADTGRFLRDKRGLLEDTRYRRSAWEDLAVVLSERLKRGERSEIINILRDGSHSQLLGHIAEGYKAMKKGAGVELSISPAQAQLLYLLYGIGPALRIWLEATENPPTELAALEHQIIVLILEEAEQLRAIAQIQRLLQAPREVQRLVDLQSDEWQRALRNVQPNLTELMQPLHGSMSPAAKARLKRAFQQARTARLGLELYELRERARKEVKRIGSELSRLRKDAECARQLIGHIRQLRAIELQSGDMPGDPAAVRLRLRLDRATRLEPRSIRGIHKAELVLTIPAAPGNGGSVQIEEEEASIVAFHDIPLGVSVQALYLEPVRIERASVLKVRPVIRARGIATALRTDVSAATRSLFGCTMQSSISQTCAVPLPNGVELQVVGVTFDLDRAVAKVRVAWSDLIPRSAPLELTIESGRTRPADIVAQVESAISDALLRRFRNGGAALASFLHVNHADGFSIDKPQVGISKRFTDGVIRGSAQVSVNTLPTFVRVRWRLESSENNIRFRIYRADIPNEIKQQALLYARQRIEEIFALPGFNGDINMRRALASYISLRNPRIVLDDGVPQRFHAQLAIAAIPNIPTEITSALSRLEVTVEKSGPHMEMPPGFADDLRRVFGQGTQRILRQLRIRVPAPSIGNRISLFGAEFIVTQVVNDQFDIIGRVDGIELSLSGLRYQDHRLDLSGIKVSGALVEDLLQVIRALVPSLASEYILLEHPRFGLSHLIVDVSLRIPQLDGLMHLGAISIDARGSVRVQAGALKSLDRNLARHLDQWLASLPEGALEAPGIAKIEEARVGDDFRLFTAPPRVSLIGHVRLAGRIKVPVSVTLLPEFSMKLVGSPRDALLGALKELGVAFLGEAIESETGIQPYLIDRPFGLVIPELSIPIWDSFKLKVGGLRITTAGVELPTSFGAELPFDIPLGAGFILVHPGFEVDIRDAIVTVSGDLTFGSRGIERLIKVACDVRAHFKAVRLEIEGLLVFYDALRVSKVDGIIDILQMRASLESRMTGPLARILQLNSTAVLDGGNQTLAAEAFMEVLGLRLADAKLIADATPPHIKADVNLRLPIVETRAKLEAGLDLSRVRIEANAGLKLGGFDIASAGIHLRMSRCIVEFALFGFTVRASAPGPHDLTPALLLDIINSLFDFDPIAFFEGLLSGGISVNLMDGGADGGDGSTTLGDGDPVQSLQPEDSGDKENGSDWLKDASPDGSPKSRKTTTFDDKKGPNNADKAFGDEPIQESNSRSEPGTVVGPQPGRPCFLDVRELQVPGGGRIYEAVKRCPPFVVQPIGAIGANLANEIRGGKYLLWTEGIEFGPQVKRWTRRWADYAVPGAEEFVGGTTTLGYRCRKGSQLIRPLRSLMINTIVLVRQDNQVVAAQAIQVGETSWHGFSYRQKCHSSITLIKWLAAYCRKERRDLYIDITGGGRMNSIVENMYWDEHAHRWRKTQQPIHMACPSVKERVAGELLCDGETIGTAIAGEKSCFVRLCRDTPNLCRRPNFGVLTDVETILCPDGQGAECLEPLLMNSAKPIDIAPLQEFIPKNLDTKNLYTSLQNRGFRITMLKHQIWQERVRALLDGRSIPISFDLESNSKPLAGLLRAGLVLSPPVSGFPELRIIPVGQPQRMTISESSTLYRELDLAQLVAERKLSPAQDLFLRLLFHGQKPEILDVQGGHSTEMILYNVKRDESGRVMEAGSLVLTSGNRLAAAAILANTPWFVEQVKEPSSNAATQVDLIRVKGARFLRSIMRAIPRRDDLLYSQIVNPQHHAQSSIGSHSTDVSAKDSISNAKRREPLPRLYLARGRSGGTGKALMIDSANVWLFFEARAKSERERIFRQSRAEVERRLGTMLCEGLLEPSLERDLIVSREQVCAEAGKRRVPLTPLRVAMLTQVLFGGDGDNWRDVVKVNPMFLLVDMEENASE